MLQEAVVCRKCVCVGVCGGVGGGGWRRIEMLQNNCCVGGKGAYLSL